MSVPFQGIDEMNAAYYRIQGSLGDSSAMMKMMMEDAFVVGASIANLTGSLAPRMVLVAF